MKLWILFLLAGLPAFFSQAQSSGTATNLWQVGLIGSGTESSPAMAPDGTIYQGTFRGWLLAVSPDGKTKWQFKAGREIKSSPAVAPDGTVYFGARDRKFYALTPAGKLKWTFNTDAWVDSSPALAADGTVYFGSWDKIFYAVNPDGSLKWKFATSNIIDASPAIATDGTIYFGSHDKNFYALTPAGKLKWQFATHGEIESSPAIGTHGEIYFTANDGNLYALRPDGSKLWQLHTDGFTAASPVLNENGDLFLNVNNSFTSVSSAGKMRWQRMLPAITDSTPACTASGAVYFALPWHMLIAESDNGQELWQIDTDDFIPSAPNINNEGKIYAANYQYLLAIQPAAAAPPAKSSWPMWRANPQHTGRVEIR